ncbi:MAG: heme b synthase [Candidatus Desulfofervidaceae bacterium]|nr:heme b synthase [Candidatus Desulfofervidaceae bacterium]MDL1970703.1 heme b synthase [Candidatus Desulfofervidaceae bacterium]
MQNKIPPLRLLAWELTKRCNLACKHCRAEAIDKPIPGELTTEEAKAILEDIATFAQPIIILTGGEPLMREDLLELAAYGTEKGLRMVLATNGTLLTPQWVKDLKRAGIKRVSISIDGATATAHDTFRGVKGAFERTMAGIEALKTGGLEFQINTTITKTNLQEISAIQEIAIKLGAVAHHIFLLVPMGRAEHLMNEVITPQEYEDVLSWLVEQRGRLPIQVKATCAPQYYRILRQKAKEKGEKVTFATHGLDAVTRGCLAGMGFCFVSSMGKVQTCGYLEVECGDVRKEPLSQIWRNSEIFNKLRDKKQYKGKCGQCEYWQVCGGCRARAYALTGDYLAQEPMCLYQPMKIKE